MYDYDVLSIGAGSGGCASAMRSADLGKKTGLVEYRKNGTGGTCVSRGCIPTKVLLQSAKVYSEVLGAKEYGIAVSDAKPDMRVIHQKKMMAVNSLKFGLDNMLIKPRGIDRLQGKARLIDAHTVELVNGEEKKTVTAENIIIATGSEPAMIPAFHIDRKNIITSDEALNLQEMPEELIIVGAGALGLEFADIFSTFGSKVTIVEMMPHVVPTLKDSEITGAVSKYMEKNRITLKCGSGIQTIQTLENGRVCCELANGEKIEADKALVAIGRSLNTKELNLEELGVEMTPRGQIITDDQMRTSVPGIYAVGDITAGPQLSHKAQKQGLIAAEVIAGNDAHMRYDVIPSAIFIHPEIAMVGITADEAKEQGIETLVGKMRFSSNEKAMAMQKTTGLIKVTARKEDHKIIGGHIFGEDASVLIEEIATAIQNGLTLDDVADSIHAHPTLSEIVMETCKNALGKAFHK
ncbi:dihydrolipoyl dehydrogenase [Schaedlerella sp.]|uniref:dihydrolipoyl dehydrogenase n=1 Tax=Schaedlerella sp. TaxID=2676057 RepID=UPI0037476C5E